MSNFTTYIMENLKIQIPINPYDLFKQIPTSYNRPTSSTFNREAVTGKELRYNIPKSNTRNIFSPQYCCIVCLKIDHYLKQCPEVAKQKTTDLTPYQGNKMCCGKFKCPKCKRKWVSSCSWANRGQDCVKCKITVMPHKQWAHENQHEIPKVSQYHPEGLCEQCKRLGHNCRKMTA